MAELLNHLRNWKPFRVLVIGDFMLDQIVMGDAERLTADAPVPVLHLRETDQNPGGAANVCMNLVALGAEVAAFGVVGDDGEGKILRQCLRGAGVNTSGIVTDSTRPTTVKRSLVGRAQHRHPQKMFRLDHESTEPIATDIVNLVSSLLEEAIPQCDVVAIEDYAKGVVTRELAQAVITIAREAGKEVIVDPAGSADYSIYSGGTAITPNRSEAEKATGLPACPDASIEINAGLARALRERSGVANIVLTLDRHGALLLDEHDKADAIPTVAREVYDVTGAGDMVLAGLVAGRAQGMAWTDAVRLANTAAGLEVEVFGARPIPIERLHQQVLAESRTEAGKLRTLDEALIEAAAIRREGGTVVFTNGCFDILHAGHIRLLQKAKACGDFLIVGLNSDASITRLKGEGRPVHSQSDRVAVMSELESVGAVVVFDEDTPMSLLESIRPEVLVKGGDYTKDQVVGHELVQSYGGRVELIDALEGRSTSEAIAKLDLR